MLRHLKQNNSQTPPRSLQARVERVILTAEPLPSPITESTTRLLLCLATLGTEISLMLQQAAQCRQEPLLFGRVSDVSLFQLVFLHTLRDFSKLMQLPLASEQNNIVTIKRNEGWAINVSSGHQFSPFFFLCGFERSRNISSMTLTWMQCDF